MNKIERRTPYTPSSSLSGYRRSVGSLLFDQRRWLNPNAEADRALLQQVLHLCLPKKQTVSKLQDHDYHFPVVSIKARSDRSLLGTAPSIHSIPQISLSRAPLEGRGTADCMPGSRRSSPCRSPPSWRSSARCGYSPCNDPCDRAHFQTCCMEPVHTHARPRTLVRRGNSGEAVPCRLTSKRAQMASCPNPV